jgi:hypothetical protein
MLSKTIEPAASRCARLIAIDPDAKQRHFRDVILIGKLLSANVYFQTENENEHNRTEHGRYALLDLWISIDPSDKIRYKTDATPTKSFDQRSPYLKIIAFTPNICRPIDTRWRLIYYSHSSSHQSMLRFKNEAQFGVLNSM